MGEKTFVQTSDTEKTIIIYLLVKFSPLRPPVRESLRELDSAELPSVQNVGTENTISVILTGETPFVSELSVEKTDL